MFVCAFFLYIQQSLVDDDDDDNNDDISVDTVDGSGSGDDDIEEMLMDLPVNVRPEIITANLRPGVPEKVKITVSPPESISVDMYVLMDLSLTMADDLIGLRGFGEELGKAVTNNIVHE